VRLHPTVNGVDGLLRADLFAAIFTVPLNEPTVDTKIRRIEESKVGGSRSRAGGGGGVEAAAERAKDTQKNRVV
jgi:hypothetical protein